MLLPTKQACLLSLWDKLGIMHEKPKQVSGKSLTIIGFHGDSKKMAISLPETSRSELVHHVRSFVNDALARKCSLCEWLRTLGWMNWGLNVQLLLCPALQSAYAEIQALSLYEAPVYLNATVKHDFLWFAHMFDQNSNIFLLRVTTWSKDEADIVIYCNTCLNGLAFWSPDHNLAFVSDTPQTPPRLHNNIFWFEALTVLSALC